jgi:hypothetical protein
MSKKSLKLADLKLENVIEGGNKNIGFHWSMDLVGDLKTTVARSGKTGGD